MQNHEVLSEITEELKSRFEAKLGADVEFVQVIKATPVRALAINWLLKMR